MIWRRWTNKMFVRCILWSVHLPSIQYMGCVISAYQFVFWWLWEYVYIIQRVIYALEWRTVLALTRGLFWCQFPKWRNNEGNKHQINTRVSAETVRHESTYIILFLTRHNESINDDKCDDFYTSSLCLTSSALVLLMTSQSIADDVTMTRQLWRNYVNSDI